MKWLEKIQYLVAGSVIRKFKQDGQEAAFLLIRRDLELSAANDKLKKLNDAKSDFITMAAHQLRTPITAVSWSAELLLRGSAGELNDKQKGYVENINSSSVRMAHLIDTLLYISRLELGTNILNNTVFSASDLIHSIVAQLEIDYLAKEITIDTHTDSVEIFADKALFDMVIQNLLSNAIKYTPKQGIITITEKMLDANQTWGGRIFTQEQFVLSVEDTGYGVPEKQKDKIFTRMFRADNVQALGITGTGLGLYLVKLIIQKMGGEVWFTSTEGAGTTFFVAVPSALVKKIEIA